MTRLLQYVEALTKLRGRLTRTFSNEDLLLWFTDLPESPDCRVHAWAASDVPEAESGEAWLAVHRPPEPALPPPPSTCADWFDPAKLRDPGQAPTLKPMMTRALEQAKGAEAQELEPVIVRQLLAEHPEVSAAWAGYVEREWQPWASAHQTWEAVDAVYAKLFAIHQAQKRLGEEYELILGLGLLCWRLGDDKPVRRHLLVASAGLDFDAEHSRFSVGPAEDGARLRLELDMLDARELPPGVETTAKQSLQDADGDPWNKPALDAVFNGVAHGLHAEGEYADILTAGTGATTVPRVTLSPALLLRHRSSHGLAEVLAKIRSNIEVDGPVPPAFADLAEMRPDADAGPSAGDPALTAPPPAEIYFPKPANDEQRAIVRQQEHHRGVLVQGPPGTGKSHTIANLTCHLLATGKRLLVTARTPRALRVLQDKLPEELQPLCVNLLGEGPQEKAALESSVHNILRRKGDWNAERSARDQRMLECALHELRAERAEVTLRLRTIRETETTPQTVAGRAYRGTASRIAERVARERDTYAWFLDQLPPDRACVVDGAELLRAVTLLRSVDPAQRDRLLRSLPESLPAPEHFAALVAQEAAAAKVQQAAAADPGLTDLLARSDLDALAKVRATLEALQLAWAHLPTTVHAWLPAAIAAIVAGSTATWQERQRATQAAIQTLEQTAEKADTATIALPADVDPRRAREDGLALEQHLQSGGKLGFGLFRPKPVRERQYLLHTATVNGQPADTPARLALLIAALDAQLAGAAAWRAWQGQQTVMDGPYQLQLAALKAMAAALRDAFALTARIADCRVALQACIGVAEPNWADATVRQGLLAACRAVQLRVNTQALAAEIETLEAPLSGLLARGNTHPLTQAATAAVRTRDVDGYAAAFAAIQTVAQRRREIHVADDAVAELCAQLPETGGALLESIADPAWDIRLPRIADAWHWAQAQAWINRYVSKDDVPALQDQVHQIDERISTALAKLASLLAWAHCVERLGVDEQRHMQSWKLEIERLGKGTGRHAERHRRAAREHLDACRGAVPAWVMPLYRLWDTIEPQPGMFDVVIVDEASQCGLEAVPLFYLAKQLIVVGDDKQISPEAVGVEGDSIEALRRQYLADFEYATLFDPKSSLFDLGHHLYGSSNVMLREHFRCMPEIIGFSNRLSYHDQPLIPLRQYTAERLPPLEHVFVASGNREGDASRVVNQPEADALAERVVAMCNDPRYIGKTMGVVTLQGKAQAGLIEGKLLQQLDPSEIEERRLICGDPYSFQGDERDIMFISLVAAAGQPFRALTGEADRRRFNVAASRARDMMLLFHSVRTSDLRPDDFRSKLLEYFLNPAPQEIAGIVQDKLEREAAKGGRAERHPPMPFDSWFEVDVALALLRRRFAVISQFEFAGYRIDLVVDGGRARLAVECDGDHWHGAEQYDRDMARQRQLERCGWHFFRVRESAFYSNAEDALAPLWALLQERGIEPAPSSVPAASDVPAADPGLPVVEISQISAATPTRRVLEPVATASEPATPQGPPLSATATGNDSLDALTVPDIEQAIVAALTACPNHTCTVDSLVKRVLAVVGIITRGQPRVLFAQRSDLALQNLLRAGRVERYHATNDRLRLIER